MNKIKILLADNHVTIRSTVRSLLLQNEHVDLVAEVANKTQLLEKVHATRPDIVLADIAVPQLECLDVIEELHYQYPSTNFIILTMHFERDYIVRAIKAGVKGYLHKDSERTELRLAIKQVYEGGKYFDWTVANVLAEAIVHPDQQETCDLTTREKEVLELVSNGKSSRTIAALLTISVRTVEAYRVRLLKRLSVGNTAQLIRKATQLHLIDF